MNDLTKKSVEELKKLEEESRAELFALRFQSAMGNLEKPHRIGELKKQIARILTILSARKNAGENTAINVKVNLNETYAKIEKESQAFAKQRKAKIEQMMAEQQAAEGKMANLMDLPLNDAMDLTEEQAVASTPIGETNGLDEQKAPVAAKKPAAAKDSPKQKDVAEEKTATGKAATPSAKKAPVAKKDVAQETKTDKDAALKALIKEKAAEKKPTAKSKTSTPSDKTTVTVKSVTSAKADIEVPKETKKAASTKTVKKATELNAKEKLAAIKSSVAMGGTAKGRGSGVKIDLELKAKDPNAKEYTYGTNWKENRDKILTASKTTKKADDKTTKKGTGKK
ncbi:50S ribosomal protein L29 [Spiroplasma melliferum IPMB4A]|uniref:Large ribosomal subunit protein uL29 n=2 Tax=Spiroplasma melliferum TaxID=2134 RepID=A0AAI9T2D0_SPIME|nr:50S ribosomal protein L29 [Spiroplasma melliferum IPMB4A]KAI92090.1 50S ribosomal protein L29 [Spiroplasma melliferum KC3]QCO23502.1 50S ribosomal protein L29 [Spiroplasma melliferum]